MAVSLNFAEGARFADGYLDFHGADLIAGLDLANVLSRALLSHSICPARAGLSQNDLRDMALYTSAATGRGTEQCRASRGPVPSRCSTAKTTNPWLANSPHMLE